MNILIADHNKSTIASINECNPSFDVELGNPLAFDIDAVVSPANTMGIMNGGYDAVLRRYFGVGIEYTERQYFDKFKLDVGEAIAVITGHSKVEWLYWILIPLWIINAQTNPVDTILYLIFE